MAYLRLTLLLSIMACGFAQPSITSQGSMPVVLQADEVHFGITITADPSVPFSRILEVVRPLGIGQEAIASVSTETFGPDRGKLAWRFTLIRPVSALSGSLDQLASLPSGFKFGYAIQRLSVPDAAREAALRAAFPALWKAARDRAQSIASQLGEPLPALHSLTLNESAILVIPASWGFIGAASMGHPELEAVFAPVGDPHTAGVTVTMDAPQPPAEFALLSVAVTGPLTFTLNDALGVLRPYGVRASDLQSAYLRESNVGPFGPAAIPAEAVWSFRITSPFSQLSNLLTLIAPGGDPLPPGVKFELTVNGVAPGSSIPSVPIPPPVLEIARARAALLASAAGMQIGPIVAVEGSTRFRIRFALQIK